MSYTRLLRGASSAPQANDVFKWIPHTEPQINVGVTLTWTLLEGYGPKLDMRVHEMGSHDQAWGEHAEHLAAAVRAPLDARSQHLVDAWSHWRSGRIAHKRHPASEGTTRCSKLLEVCAKKEKACLVQSEYVRHNRDPSCEHVDNVGWFLGVWCAVVSGFRIRALRLA